MLYLEKSILAVFLLSMTSAFAQFKGAPKKTLLWCGPKIGINVSNFYADTNTLYNQYKVFVDSISEQFMPR